MAPPESDKIAINPYTDLPETVPTNEGKILVDTTDKQLAEEDSAKGYVHIYDKTSRPRPLWRRRWFLVLVGILVCGIIAGVVAGVVTSRKNKSDGYLSSL